MKLPEGFVLENQKTDMNLPEGFQVEKSKPRKDFGESLYHGYQMGGQNVKQSIGNIIQNIGDVMAKVGLSGGGGAGMLSPLAAGLNPDLQNVVDADKEFGKGLRDLGIKIAREADDYVKMHPEQQMQFESEGLINNWNEMFSRPELLLQGAMESLPYTLEGVLGTIVAGPAGGFVAMLPQVYGNTYGQARKDGEDPTVATLHALIDSSVQSIIESYTLGKNFQLANKVFKGELRGFGKYAWNALKTFSRGTAEETSQQWTQNLWRYIFGDRKQELMQGVVQSAAMGGPLELAMGVSMGGTAAAFSVKQVNTTQKINRVDKIIEMVNKSPYISDIQKEEINQAMNGVKDEQVENFYQEIKDKYTDIVSDNTSLANLGNKMAVDFGLTGDDLNIIWKLIKTNRTGTLLGDHEKLKTGEHLIRVFNRPNHNTQQALQKTMTHEIEHIINPAKDVKVYDPPLTKLPTNVNTIQNTNTGNWEVQSAKYGIVGNGPTKESATVDGLNRLNSFEKPKRKVHFPKFESDLEQHLKQLQTTERKSVIDKIVDVHNKNGGSTINFYTGEEITKGFAVAISSNYEQKIDGNKITRQQLLDYVKKHFAVLDADRYNVAGTSVKGGKTYLDISTVVPTLAEAKILGTKNIQKTIFDLENKQSIPIDEIYKRVEQETETGPKVEDSKGRLSIKKLLALGHKIPQLMGWTDEQRRDVIEDITGQRSLKGLDRASLENVVSYMQEQFGEDVEIKPEDYQKPIQLGDRVTTMEHVINETVKQVDSLPNQVNIPARVKRSFRQKDKGVLTWAKDLFFGIDNDTISTLAWYLDGGKNGILGDVFTKNMNRGFKNTCAHTHTTFDYVNSKMKEFGMTGKDFAQMSASANPRFRFLETLAEEFDKGGTTIYTTEINGRKYDITMSNLMELYKILQQEDGRRHVLVGGLQINGVLTGAISQAKLKEMVDLVGTNPKAIQILNLFAEINKGVWQPSLNQTALSLGEEEFAKEENWWGLNVYYPKRLAGKVVKFDVNFIENKSIFKDRTKSTAPLILGDIFDNFNRFEVATAEYVGMAEPLRVARTVLNQTKIANTLDKKGYGKFRHHILEILRRAQSTPTEYGSFEKILSHIMKGGYRALLTWNPRVWASQFTSTMVYGAYVDPKYLKHIKDGVSNELVNETLKLSDVAWNRFYLGSAGGSFELGELSAHQGIIQPFVAAAKGLKLSLKPKDIYNLFTGSSDVNKLNIMLKLSDIMALASGLSIARTEYKDAQNGKISGDSALYWAGKDVSAEEGSDGFNRMTTERAEDLWEKSQPSWDKWHRSMITSESKISTRMFFLFRSFHEKALNTHHRAKYTFEHSNKTIDDVASYSRKDGAIVASYMFNIVLRSLILGLTTWRIKKLPEYLIDLIVAPFAMFPIVGKIIDTSIRNFTRTLFNMKPEYRGNTVQPFVLKIIDLLNQAPDNFSQAAAFYATGRIDEGNKALKRAIGKVYEGVGIAEGIPIYEIRNIGKAFEDEDGESGTGQGRRVSRRGGRRR